MRKLLALALALAACGGGGDDDTATPGPPMDFTVKVMTINLRHDEDEWERRFALIADEIVRLDPDLVGMQEIEMGTGEASQTDQVFSLRELIAARGGTAYEAYDHLKWWPYGVETGEGVGILSRYPMLASGAANLSDGGRVTVWARVAVADGYSLDMFDTHFEGNGDDSVRVNQAQLTLDFMDQQAPGRPRFLTGDLNTTPDEPAYSTFTDVLTDSYLDVHGAADTEANGNTSPIILMEGATQDPIHRIDYVFDVVPSGSTATVDATDSIVCFQNHDDAGFYPSDHLGVMSTFDITIPGD